MTKKMGQRGLKWWFSWLQSPEAGLLNLIQNVIFYLRQLMDYRAELHFIEYQNSQPFGVSLSSMIAPSHVWLIKLKFINWNKKFSCSATLATFHILSSHMWSVAAIFCGADMEHGCPGRASCGLALLHSRSLQHVKNDPLGFQKKHYNFCLSICFLYVLLNVSVRMSGGRYYCFRSFTYVYIYHPF